MNKIHKAIRDKIVEPEMRKKPDNTIGIVAGSNFEEGFCNVEITNPITGEELMLREVPISKDFEEGFSGSFIEEGDYVIVDFSNGNIKDAKIIKKHIKNHRYHIQENYQTEKGVYTSDAHGYF